MNRITIDTEHDYSRSFQMLRPVIIDGSGVKYLEFLRTLKPFYPRVMADIGLGYGALAVTATIVVVAPSYGCPVWVGILFGALSIGFWVAYLQLFIHEGAHFNLSQDRDRSDLLTNILIAWMVGTSVQQYRQVHFQHHRALGHTDDSEMTYFFPLNLLFIFKGLFGVRVIEVLFTRRALEVEKGRAAAAGRYVGLTGIFIHMMIVTSGFILAAPWFSITWILGTGMVFPLLGALRQLLEHRDPNASPQINYLEQNHGAYTRIFGSDIFSSLFGAAGFNRHLLHHWEPQVSYTNLKQLEMYLLDTDVAPIIEKRRTSYTKTFQSLFKPK